AYRENFRPSRYLSKPYVAAAMNVFAADSETDARKMMSSMQQQFIALRRGTPGPLKAPVDDIRTVAAPHELAGANHALTYTAVGTKDSVQRHINQFIDDTGIDEVILTCHAFDHQARLRSLEIAAEALNGK
ncbi:MAG: LLM class flavin-dependent oxidoreductase, partial [Idiomarina loihiensis]